MLSGEEDDKITCVCVGHHNSSRTREAQARGWDVQCLMEDHPLDAEKKRANFGQPGHLSVPTCLLGVSELHTAFNKQYVHSYDLGVAAPSDQGTHIDDMCDTHCLLVFHPCNILGRRCG